MSIFTKFFDRLIDWTYEQFRQSYFDRSREILDVRKYRMGFQKEFLKPSRDGHNDNQIANNIGLITDRLVSILFGKGVEFDYGESAGTDEEGDPLEKSTPTKDFIDDQWKRNKKPILLQKFAENGVQSGQVFCKIAPQDDGNYRLVALDSMLMDVRSNPTDMDDIEEFVCAYKSTDRQGREMSVKEITSKDIDIKQGDMESVITTWTIDEYQSSDATNGHWKKVKTTKWDYDFAPIVTCQNLININDVWGLPDITSELIGLQNQYNFGCSNRNKLIRYYAQPLRWSVGLNNAETAGRVVDGKKQKQSGDDLGIAPDKMIKFNNGGNGEGLYQLEGLGDLTAVNTSLDTHRMNMFTVSRTVDITTMYDKVGQLTNFGLRVIYQDALQKNETKRQLYGDFLQEINRRLLILSNMGEAECELTWPDPLPENEKEETEFLEADLRMGVCSKQTAAEKRGYKWEDEKKRMETEQAAMDDLGGALMKAFDRNGGVNPDKQPFGRQV